MVALENDQPVLEPLAGPGPLLSVENLVKVYPGPRPGLFARRRPVTVVITAGASCPNNLSEDAIRRLFLLRSVVLAEFVRAVLHAGELFRFDVGDVSARVSSRRIRDEATHSRRDDQRTPRARR